MEKTKIMKRNLYISLSAVLAASLLLAACNGGQQSKSPARRVVTGVQLQTVRLQSLPAMIDAVGTVSSVNTSVLSAQIAGTVREIRVKPGDRVRRGEVLAVLDDRAPLAQLGMAKAGVEEASQGLVEIDHDLQAAQANLQFATATYKRYQGLLAKSSISPQEFDGAQARYKAALANEQALEAKKKQIEAKQQQARSQQSSAQTLYSYSTIVSPLTGVVVTKAVDAGTVVMPGTPVLTVEDARYRLEVSVPEELMGSIRLGQEVAVSLRKGEFQGSVTEIVPAADPASRTFVVKIDLPQDCGCRSGEYGKASLPLGVDKSLLVPRTAVVRRGELEAVFVANQNRVLEFRLVKTGRMTGGRVEILSGLSAGEQVAVTKVDQLQDGEQVGEQ